MKQSVKFTIIMQTLPCKFYTIVRSQFDEVEFDPKFAGYVNYYTYLPSPRFPDSLSSDFSGFVLPSAETS